MLEKHFKNDLNNDTLFSIIGTGYLNNLIGIEYIRHFHKITEYLCKGKYRMLVFNSHGSYISNDFTLVF